MKKTFKLVKLNVEEQKKEKQVFIYKNYNCNILFEIGIFLNLNYKKAKIDHQTSPRDSPNDFKNSKKKNLKQNIF